MSQHVALESSDQHPERFNSFGICWTVLQGVVGTLSLVEKWVDQVVFLDQRLQKGRISTVSSIAGQ